MKKDGSTKEAASSTGARYARLPSPMQRLNIRSRQATSGTSTTRVVGEEGRFVEIATTRPETLLGDTAVAVNPEDERYTDIVGKMLKLPLTDREIPVIADAYVDKEFGTGCVKITPAQTRTILR